MSTHNTLAQEVLEGLCVVLCDCAGIFLSGASYVNSKKPCNATPTLGMGRYEILMVW